MLRDEVQLVITGKNVTQAAFAAVNNNLRDLNKQVAATNTAITAHTGAVTDLTKAYTAMSGVATTSFNAVIKSVDLATASIRLQIKALDDLIAKQAVAGGMPGTTASTGTAGGTRSNSGPRVAVPPAPSAYSGPPLTPAAIGALSASAQRQQRLVQLTNAGLSRADATAVANAERQAAAQAASADAANARRLTLARNQAFAGLGESVGISGRLGYSAILGAGLAGGAALGIGFVGYQASKAGSDFQSAAFQTLAQSGYGKDQRQLAGAYKQLSGGILNYEATGKDPYNAVTEAQGIQPLISHYGLTNALAMLPSVARLSAQNKAPDLTDAVNLVNTFTANVGAGSKATPAQVADIADYVSKLETITTVPPGRLTGAFPNILTSIQGTGISPEDAGGLFLKIAQAAPANVQRDSTNFARLIIEMTRKNTVGANKAAQGLFGSSFGPGFIEQFGGILPAIQAVNTATAGPNQGKLLGQLFPQVNALRAFQEVLGGQGLGLAGQYSKELGDRAGAGTNAFNTLSMGVNQQANMLMNHLNGDMARLGSTLNEKVIPALINFADHGLTSLEQAFKAASDLLNNPDFAKSFASHLISIGDKGFANPTVALKEAQADTIAERKRQQQAAAAAKNPNSTYTQTHAGKVVQTNEGAVFLPEGGGQAIHLGPAFSKTNYGNLPASQVHVQNMGMGQENNAGRGPMKLGSGDTYFQLVPNTPRSVVPDKAAPSLLQTQPGGPGDYYSGFYANYAKRHHLTVAQQNSGGPLPPTLLIGSTGIRTASGAYDVSDPRGHGQTANLLHIAGYDVSDPGKADYSHVPFLSTPNYQGRTSQETILANQLAVLNGQKANTAAAMNQATRDVRHNLNASEVGGTATRDQLAQGMADLRAALTTSAYSQATRSDIIAQETHRAGSYLYGDDNAALKTGLAQYKQGLLSTADLKKIRDAVLSDIPLEGLSKGKAAAQTYTAAHSVDQAIYIQTQLDAANMQLHAAQINQESARIHHESFAVQQKDARATYAAAQLAINAKVVHGDLKGVDIKAAYDAAKDTLDTQLAAIQQQMITPFQDRITNAQLKNDPAAFKKAIQAEIGFYKTPDSLHRLFGDSTVAQGNAILQAQQQIANFTRTPGPQLIRPNTQGLGFGLAGPGSTIAELSGGAQGRSEELALLRSQLQKEEQANSELRQMVAYLRTISQTNIATEKHVRPKPTPAPPGRKGHGGGRIAA